MAIPTPSANPYFKAPVPLSTPRVMPCSRWPGVMLPHCLKPFNWLTGRSYSDRWSQLYSNMEPCPVEITKRSRSAQRGLAGLCFKQRLHSM